MIYGSAADWRACPNKRVLLFGMSGLGKTHMSNMLRESGEWYHYSVDYRIGTRYMGEHIADNYKRAAMAVPLLRELLLSDSIFIGSNITFGNLAPLSTYLGKPGDPEKGGLAFAEYMRRLEQHRQAEIAALLDTGHFIDRAMDIYGYPNFVCDTGGSICEVVDPMDPDDPVLTHLAQRTLLVWIRGTEDHAQKLAERFDRAPKPMYYPPGILQAAWDAYRAQTGLEEAEIDPDAFVRWTYARAMAHRQPQYAAMADRWGVQIDAGDVETVRDKSDFEALIASAIGAE